MTETNSQPQPFDEARLRQAVELLYFAYRDFTAGPDAILADYGFGRAHHRTIYFVGRAPGITVKDLLRTLKITKQSLNRVLGQLIREGFIEQKTGKDDRRQRLLTLTRTGKTLERRLSETQFDHISAAFDGMPKGDVDGFYEILKRLINEADRQRFESA